MPPLAERMRPQSLSDYVGQKHIMGEGAVLRNAIAQSSIPSMILWGPPGRSLRDISAGKHFQHSLQMVLTNV